MRKLFLTILILLFAYTAQAGWYYGADPCVDAGCTGTYEICANGEMPDSSYACQDSGASNVDATDEDAGVINASSPITGSYDYLLDADGEGVTWALTTPNTLHQAGTIECKVKTPSSFTAAEALFFGVGTAASLTDNEIMTYTTGNNGRFYGRVEAGGTIEVINAYSTMTVSTTHTVYYTWRANTSDKHCTKLDAGAWTCSTEALPDIATGIDLAFAGEPVGLGTTNAGTWQVDDCKVREGYEGD